MEDNIENFSMKAFLEELASLDEYLEYQRLRSIWRAVIYQAMVDLLTNSKNPRRLSQKLKARQFLNPQNPDFYLICEYASLDPKAVLIKARSFL